MSKEEAEKIGALHFFKAKYPERVRVYFIGSSLEDAYSKEFCGGPHIERTSEIASSAGGFKILKEEAVGAGIRRIRANISC
ncbi:MAG: Alanine--tRNA ligase [Actinobacteria bacterium]|nr:Alanine--tRNA ligase [Actinomycetota bacterium]